MNYGHMADRHADIKSRSSSSSSDSSSRSSSSSPARKKKRKKKKLKKKKLKEKKKKRRKSTSSTKSAEMPVPKPAIKPAPKPAPDIIPELVGPKSGPKQRVLKPMTKEEWEKQQSVVRKVYDEETGRERLIKGDGEVLEEIVCRDRHKEINKASTKGDGQHYAKMMGLH